MILHDFLKVVNIEELFMIHNQQSKLMFEGNAEQCIESGFDTKLRIITIYVYDSLINIQVLDHEVLS
jgi:hypothetical protein